MNREKIFVWCERLCSTVQIIGFILIVMRMESFYSFIIIAISGLAAILNWILGLRIQQDKKGNWDRLRPVAAFCGFGIFIATSTILFN